MIDANFDYHEYQRWVENLRVAQDEFDTFLKGFLLRMAQRVVRNAKMMHRNYKSINLGTIDTGHMINSWYIGKNNAIVDKEISNSELANLHISIIEVNGSNLQIEIGNNAEYASHVEYGHHNYFPRLILTVSIDTIQQQMPKRFHNEFKDWLRSEGVY